MYITDNKMEIKYLFQIESYVMCDASGNVLSLLYGVNYLVIHNK